MDKSSKKPRVAIVLSAPRSGSSLLTSLLISMGLFGGHDDEMILPNEFNKRGFFERVRMQKLNEELIELSAPKNYKEILLHSGLTDTQIFEATENWLCLGADAPLQKGMVVPTKIQQTMNKLVDELHSSAKTFVWKDPRFCFTLPIWMDHINPVCILIWRDPIEMSQSYASMANLPKKICQLYWSHSTRASLQVTQGLPRLIISFSDLMNNSTQTVTTISNFLKSNEIHVSDSLEHVTKIIDSDFYNHHNNSNDETGKEVLDLQLLNWLKTQHNECSPHPPPNLTYPAELCVFYRAIHRKLLEISHLKTQITDLEKQLLVHKSKLDFIQQIPFYPQIKKVLKIFKI